MAFKLSLNLALELLYLPAVAKVFIGNTFTSNHYFAIEVIFVFLNSWYTYIFCFKVATNMRSSWCNWWSILNIELLFSTAVFSIYVSLYGSYDVYSMFLMTITALETLTNPHATSCKDYIIHLPVKGEKFFVLLLYSHIFPLASWTFSKTRAHAYLQVLLPAHQHMETLIFCQVARNSPNDIISIRSTILFCQIAIWRYRRQ